MLPVALLVRRTVPASPTASPKVDGLCGSVPGMIRSSTIGPGPEDSAPATAAFFASRCEEAAGTWPKAAPQSTSTAQATREQRRIRNTGSTPSIAEQPLRLASDACSEIARHQARFTHRVGGRLELALDLKA